MTTVSVAEAKAAYAEFVSHPVAMLPTTMQAMADTVAGWDASAGPLAVAPKRDRAKGKPGLVGVIFVDGIITQWPSVLMEIFGGTSTEEVGAALRDAVEDPQFQQILMVFNSPGGSVYGVEELGRQIYAARSAKKITAAVSSVAASAAYWIASQCSEVIVTPGGEIGSIGVYVAHKDDSEALKQAGRKVTLVSAGQLKTAGHPYGPLEGEAKAELQKGVDDYHEMFLKAVARGRNTSPSAVRSGFGKGGMVRAEQAVREGMADRIGTFDSVLRAAIGRAGSPTASTAAPAPTAGFDSALELRKRKLRLSLDDDRARFAALSHRIADPPQPKPTRPADRTAEEDQRTAIHESGHVVACWAVGVAVGSATIQPTTLPGLFERERTVAGLVRHAACSAAENLVIAQAGTEAERGHYGAAALAGRDAAEVATATPAAREQARRRVEKILGSNWPAVIATANALLTERTMTGDRLREVAGRIIPG